MQERNENPCTKLQHRQSRDVGSADDYILKTGVKQTVQWLRFKSGVGGSKSHESGVKES